MEKYPLTESLGVVVTSTGFVVAADLERALSQAPVVCGWDGATWEFDNQKGHTHTARLVCVQPIVRDTAQSLLRELIATHDDRDCGPYCDHYKQTIERARKLLGEGAHSCCFITKSIIPVSDKPREWIIGDDGYGDTVVHSGPGVMGHLPVIERSAYDALAAELKAATEMFKRVNDACTERELIMIKERDAARAEVERWKYDYEGACRTLALMHEAATGERGLGPKRGVIEDVEDLRAERDRYRQALERIIEVSSGKGYSAHQAFIAQTALNQKAD